MSKQTLLASELYSELIKYHLIKDPNYNHIELENFFEPANKINLVNSTFRRQVYYIQTPFGNYFLKHSPVLRKKDKQRFLLLPWRISTEWRNLNKLKQKKIPTLQRVLFGYKGQIPCSGFFLITEESKGTGLDCHNPEQILNLADFLALLHFQGIFHKDLHPENILITHSGKYILIDVQEVFLLPWLPERLKVKNIGQIWRHILNDNLKDKQRLLIEFLQRYNNSQKVSISWQEVTKKIQQEQERYYSSRSKRIFKNSTDFQIIDKKDGYKGYKKRDFNWDLEKCGHALKYGKNIKDNKIISYDNVCLKIHNRHYFHKDRSLAAWKMARQLAVRGIKVPEGLAYYRDKKRSFFLCQFYEESQRLNTYLSSLKDKQEKYIILKQLAAWIQNLHRQNIWQRDFKSSNILVYQGQFIMVDLEGIKKCRRLSLRKKVVNLAQLNASISKAISLKDRLRFFHYYWPGQVPPRKRRRWIYKKILQITRKKNTLPFGLDLEDTPAKKSFAGAEVRDQMSDVSKNKEL